MNAAGWSSVSVRSKANLAQNRSLKFLHMSLAPEAPGEISRWWSPSITTGSEWRSIPSLRGCMDGFDRIRWFLHRLISAVPPGLGMKYERDVLYGDFGEVSLYAIEA